MKVINLQNRMQVFRLAAFGVLAALSLGQPATKAADHGDSPVASNNQNGDIADVYAFLDEDNNDNVVLIATVRGFIAPGENGNFGIFDPNIRYHFEIETTGDTKADKFIDVTFTPRTGSPPATGPAILEVPDKQLATVTFTNFRDAGGKKIKPVSELETTPPSTGPTPPTQKINENIGGTGIRFFAGLVDDPFFFDIPAFGSFIQSVRDGAPNGNVFSRARDSFAGYNVMGIALSIPATLLRGPDGTKIGVAFYTQKKLVQNPNKKTGEIKGSGGYKTIDRMGNPAVNVALIPFSRKNEYNQGTPKDDAKLKFGGDILATLAALGTNGADVSPPTDNAFALANVAVLNGDYLRLETDKAVTPNTGDGGGDNAAAVFPNGRRLKDDVVDILLTLINNGNPFVTPVVNPLGDNVNSSDPLPQNDFPFLAPPNQPFPNGTLDDKTRN